MEKSHSHSIRSSLRSFDTKFAEYTSTQTREYQSIEKQHQDAVQTLSTKITSLIREQKALEELMKQQNQNAEAERRIAEIMSAEVISLQSKATSLPQQLHQLQEEQQRYREEIARHQKEMDELQKEMRYKINELTKGVLYFKTRLGLLFDIHDGLLKITFQYVDDADPERGCWIVVHIDEQNQYLVSDCVPSLPDIDRLVEELNETNNFSHFLQSIRREFKEVVNGDKENRH